MEQLERRASAAPLPTLKGVLGVELEDGQVVELVISNDVDVEDLTLEFASKYQVTESFMEELQRELLELAYRLCRRELENARTRLQEQNREMESCHHQIAMLEETSSAVQTKFTEVHNQLRLKDGAPIHQSTAGSPTTPPPCPPTESIDPARENFDANGKKAPCTPTDVVDHKPADSIDHQPNSPATTSLTQSHVRRPSRAAPAISVDQPQFMYNIDEERERALASMSDVDRSLARMRSKLYQQGLSYRPGSMDVSHIPAYSFTLEDGDNENRDRQNNTPSQDGLRKPKRRPPPPPSALTPDRVTGEMPARRARRIVNTDASSGTMKTSGHSHAIISSGHSQPIKPRGLSHPANPLGPSHPMQPSEPSNRSRVEEFVWERYHSGNTAKARRRASTTTSASSAGAVGRNFRSSTAAQDSRMLETQSAHAQRLSEAHKRESTRRRQRSTSSGGYSVESKSSQVSVQSQVARDEYVARLQEGLLAMQASEGRAMDTAAALRMATKIERTFYKEAGECLTPALKELYERAITQTCEEFQRMGSDARDEGFVRGVQRMVEEEV